MATAESTEKAKTEEEEKKPSDDVTEVYSKTTTTTETKTEAGDAGSSVVLERRSKALRQMEYYLSDESFPFDPYLQGLLDAEKYVPLKEVASFPKMKLITRDLDEIRQALKESDIIDVSSDGEKIRRKYPTPDEDPQKARLVHCSGFKASDDADAARADVKEFAVKFGAVEDVRPLRNLTQDGRRLDGSAVVRYENEASAIKAAASNGAVRQGRKIAVYALTDWFARLKKKRDAMRKKKDETETRKKETEAEFKKGSILCFFDISSPGVAREDLKALVEGALVEENKDDEPASGSVRYVEYERDAPRGYVRLDSAAAADMAFKKLGGEPQLPAKHTSSSPVEEEDKEAEEAAAPAEADAKQPSSSNTQTVRLKVLEGQEEDEYIASAAESRKQKKRKSAGGRGSAPRHHKRQRH